MKLTARLLATLVVNAARLFNAFAVKAPIWRSQEGDVDDIATLTGGTVISDDTGRKFENVKVEDCGRR